MDKQMTNHILKRTSENVPCESKWEFNWSVFSKYIVTWLISFFVFFFMLFVVTIIKENSTEDIFYKTINTNGMLSVLLSLLFSVCVELFWENHAEKDLNLPKKIMSISSFLAVFILFLLYNTFEILITTMPDSIFFESRGNISFAFIIIVSIISVISFVILSFKRKY